MASLPNRLSTAESGFIEKGSTSTLQCVSGHLLLRPKDGIHQCIEVVEVEQALVRPAVGLSLNGCEKVVAKNGRVLLACCQIADLMFRHHQHGGQSLGRPKVAAGISQAKR